MMTPKHIRSATWHRSPDERFPASGGLLTGFVTSATGALMTPRTTASSSSASHWYATASSSTPSRFERIPAQRLDRGVVNVLMRIRLLQSNWTRGELAVVLHRVVVHADALVLEMHRLASFSIWQMGHPGLRYADPGEVLGAMEALLSHDEELADVDPILRLSTPRYSHNRRVGHLIPQSFREGEPL